MDESKPPYIFDLHINLKSAETVRNCISSTHKGQVCDLVPLASEKKSSENAGRGMDNTACLSDKLPNSLQLR